MHRVSSVVRITIGLVCLSVAVVLSSKTLGLIPEKRELTIESRVAVCESIAIYCSLLASRNNIGIMRSGLEAIMHRNPEMTYALLRRDAGGLVVELGDKDHGKDEANDESRFIVPIAQQDRRWGVLEIGYRPLSQPGLRGLIASPMVMLCLFTGASSFVVYFWYLRKLLQNLDPSKVVPDRVRKTLDTLAEGLLVLDNEERIVLANESFSKMVGESPDALMGRRASDLPWNCNGHGKQATTYPWMQSITEGKSRSGDMLGLEMNDSDARSFVVNSSPIISETGDNRGALATFDDVTQIEKNRNELQEMLVTLKESRDEVRRKNHELQLLATRDPLTSCLNRRSFFEHFETLWNTAQRFGYPLSCVLMDIDHFKSINDEYGHTAGDQVLQKLASVLHETARESDVVCRYGGEEFCILLPDTDVDGACDVAEDIRQAIESAEFDKLSVTSSFGVSAVGLGAVDPQALIDQSDNALYAAKDSGRNKVCRFDQMPDKSESDTLQRAKADATPAPSSQSSIPFHAVTALVSALSYRDARTAEHSRRVSGHAVALASKLMPASQAYIVEIAALLHDIGKIGVPDAILLKPGPLTDEEWKIMGLHDDVGVEIIRSSFECPELTQIIEQHHAWFQGNPRNPELPTGKDISLGARILGMADAYDAIVSDRVYRLGRTQEEAFKELRRCAGVQFDPELVESFIECVSSQDSSRTQQTLHVSKQTALNIGLQIENLAFAMDRNDARGLAAQAESLKRTAENDGIAEIAELAGELERAALGDCEAVQLVKLTNELLSLCRATQTAYMNTDETEIKPRANDVTDQPTKQRLARTK